MGSSPTLDRINALSRRLFEHPADAAAHYEAGRLHLAQGAAERAAAHLRVAVAADPASAAHWGTLAMALLAVRRHEPARRAAAQAIAIDAGNAEGWCVRGALCAQAGEREAARAHFERALHADPGLAHALLGFAANEAAADRIPAAIAAYARAAAMHPGLAAAHYELGVLHHRRLGDLENAAKHYRAAIAADPAHASAHHNLSHALLLGGHFDAAWLEHAWRPPRMRHEAGLARRGAHYALPALGTADAPRLAILAEQGLGDTLFFLRFAPALRARGPILDFVGDARLHAMLLRSGLFAAAAEKATALPTAARLEVLAGDLPLLATSVPPPPPLALPPEPDRLRSMRERLASLGKPPFVGIAWRAGEIATGAQETLLKQAPLEVLARLLPPGEATLLCVQREPTAEELDAAARAIGRPLHDLSEVNRDLEAALALMHVLDDYVGVSSTLVHLRAAAGLGAGVLVPFPPEWRWMAAGASPWFPGMQVGRQAADGRWPPAFS